MTIIREDRSYISLECGSQHRWVLRHREADPMLLTFRKTGPTSKHPPLHNCEPISVVSFKDRTDGPRQRWSRSNPTNGFDDPSNSFQPSCSTVKLERTRRSVGVRKHQFSSVQSLSRVQFFETPWTAAHQASLSITNSRNLLKLMSIASVMPSNHLILCHPLLLLSSIFPSISVFSNESVLCIKWPEYWSFSFSILPMNIQGWFPWGLTGLISLKSKGLSRDSSPGDLPNPGIEPRSPTFQADSLTDELSGKPIRKQVCVLTHFGCVNSLWLYGL